MREKQFSTTQTRVAGRLAFPPGPRKIACRLLACSVLVGSLSLVAPQLSYAGGTTLETGSVSASSNNSNAAAPESNPAAASHVPSAQELAALKNAVDAQPNVAKTHYAYGHALRAAGKQSQAVVEYLDASQLDPTFYVAYHELALSKPRPQQLDEAIERLKILKEHRPKELLLCVSLSELLEQKDELYPAAKVLSDLVYENSVPSQYLSKVKARIHFLLLKNKDEQTQKRVQAEEPEADAAPLPLPESSLRRSLSARQLKDAKVMQNFGHAPLLP